MSISKIILKNANNLKFIGWLLFPIHAFIMVSEKGSGPIGVIAIIGVLIGALLSITAIVGLALFVTNENLRTNEFFSALIPFIGCFLIWLMFLVLIFY